MRYVIFVTAALLAAACSGHDDHPADAAPDPALVAQGKDVFRFDTFGDEAQWTDKLRMHEVIAAAVDPATALSVGLKVDAEALPPPVVQGIQTAASASRARPRPWRSSSWTRWSA